ncbi:hypothetical protein ACN28S_58840 [Cystobacter fuscus]
MSIHWKTKTPEISDASRMGWKNTPGAYASVPMSRRSCRFGFHAPFTCTPKCCVAPMRMRVWYVSS